MPNPQYSVVVDEVDGTGNYFRCGGVLPYCTVVSILQGHRLVFADAVAAGIMEHRSGAVWLSERGRGAVVNSFPAGISGRRVLDLSTLVSIDHFAAGGDTGLLADIHARAWVKDFGSAELHLAGVASGTFDAYVDPRQKAH